MLDTPTGSPTGFEESTDTLSTAIMNDMQARLEMFQQKGGSPSVILAALVKTASMAAIAACEMIDRSHPGSASAFDAIRDSLKEDIELTYTVQAGVSAESEPDLPSE